MVPDQIFTVTEDGMQFTFKHPATGLEHCFTALSLVPEALNPNFLTNHPCFYNRLNYALEPSISPENFTVVDCDPGDPVDGGISAQRTVNFPVKTPVVGHWAVSSLRYTPADQITWRTIFRQRTREDQCVSLLP
jgi:hypothetical protein